MSRSLPARNSRFDCVADLKGGLTWHAPGSTAAAEHRVDVFHISVKPTRSKCSVVRPWRIAVPHSGQAVLPDAFAFFRTCLLSIGPVGKRTW